MVDSAVPWLWEVGSLTRSPNSVWARHPRALAFRVGCDLGARLEGARTAYATARIVLAESDVDIAEVLAELEREAADLQRERREVAMVGEALAGRRWRDRL
jgi:hypothetical protein